MSAIEYRLVQPATELTVDQDMKAKAGGGRTLRGCAAVWHSESLDLGGFREIIRPGTFAASLKKSDVRAFWDHKSRYVLARMSAGTLQLSEDEKGLAFSLSPPATQWAHDLMVSVGRKDIRQMSFAFAVDPGGDTWSRPKGRPIRELLSVTLQEISVVTFPVYPATHVYVRDQINPEILAELARSRARVQQLVVG
ncbi:MAG: HK97 family phage prohead protease [Nitrospirales bacterium]